MAQVRPTVKTDFRSRVVAFDSILEARDEAAGYLKDTERKARIIIRKDVYNVVISQR